MTSEDVTLSHSLIARTNSFSCTSLTPGMLGLLMKESYNFMDVPLFARDAAYRSIITSLLTFLLEGKDLQLQIGLRSHHGGSLEPFLTHLFKGGLIFESLLKRKYGASGNTLGPYLNAGKADLSLSSKPLYKELSTPIKLEDIPAFLQNWSGKDFHEGAIAIAYAVRNTTGHDLGWQDIFTEDVYKVLFDGIVNAIFWVIKKAYNV
jgi:hypothetical protein